jgi:AraC-like DNA-binding protein
VPSHSRGIEPRGVILRPSGMSIPDTVVGHGVCLSPGSARRLVGRRAGCTSLTSGWMEKGCAVPESLPDTAVRDARSSHAIELCRSDVLWPGPVRRADVGASPCAGTRDAAGAEQLEALRSYGSQQCAPMRLSTDNVDDFQARARSKSLGAVHLFDVCARNALVISRPRKLIDSSDPHNLKVSVQLRGVSVVAQGDQQAKLGPGDFVLYDTTRPYQISTDASIHIQTLIFSRDALRLSASQLERLTSRRISGRNGLGALVSQYLVGLGQLLNTGVCSGSWHLAEAALELLAASFAEQLACTGTTDLDSGRAGLLLRIQAYITHRLGDPSLDAPMIAAAHHISLRSLQRLFEGEGQTVTGWIRAQRLEHCRRDLANPILKQQPVRSVSAKWGLFDAAHFSRLFKAAYAFSPVEYRAKMLTELGYEAS